jgi:TonB family protein
MADLHNDIKKYLQGELTPAEMHALEKRALSDPFLADALEGGESMQGQDFHDDINLLQAFLQDRIQKKKTPAWTWTARIAAGILLIFVTGYIVFEFSGVENTRPDLALNKKQKSTPEPLSSQPEVKKETTTTFDNDIKANQNTPEEPKHVDARPQASPIEQDEINALKSEAAQESIENPVEVEQRGPLHSYTDSTEINPADGYSPAPMMDDQLAKRKTVSPEGTLAGRASGAQMNEVKKIIRGKVTDAEDGTDLPGVVVSVKGTQEGTVTDADGNYEIALAAQPAELVFSFVGLQTLEVPVKNQDSVNVTLESDVSELSEVVVVGYSAEKDVIRAEELSSYQLAEPKGGKKAFKNYLVQNMQYPQQALEHKIEGKVTVQFSVETSGLLNDFRVTRGIGYGCDEEVIRLVKAGPKWSPTKRNDVPSRSKVKVRLRFSLPD